MAVIDPYAFGFNPRDYDAMNGGSFQPNTDPNIVGWDQIDTEADFDLDPWTFAHDTGFYPTIENGEAAPYDQLSDWYYNNPDAQPYIEDYWAGGSGDLSQPPPGSQQPPPATQPPPASPPPASTGTGGTAYPPGYGFPSITTAEPLQMSEQDRIWAAAQGDLLEQGYRDSQNNYETAEGNFRDQAVGGQGGYGSILAGEGGYNPEQSGNILQEGLLKSGMASPEDYAANFYSPEELAAIKGDPYAAYNMAIGNLAFLDQWLREGDAAQRGAVSALDTDLNAAVDPTKLTLSDEYKSDFQFGQADADLMMDQAGRVAGANALARDQALRDAAFAHGNTSPIALETARGRNAVYGDVAAADSITDAQLKGKGLMLDVARSREQDRLDAERDLSGRQRDIASEIRQTQLGTEKGISDAWNQYGQYNTNLKVDTTGQAEAAASQRAGQVAANRQDANQANINTRFGQAGTASDALSGRYGQVYGQQKQEEAEGRKFLTDQQAMAQAGNQAGQDRRLGLFGSRANATGAATGRAIQAKNLPTFIDKAAGFAGGLLGG